MHVCSAIHSPPNKSVIEAGELFHECLLTQSLHLEDEIRHRVSVGCIDQAYFNLYLCFLPFANPLRKCHVYFRAAKISPGMKDIGH